MHSRLIPLAITAASLFVACDHSSAAEPRRWPQFRGPGSRGVSTSANLPARWDTNTNVAWKTGLPGMGWSSPIVWDDHIFLTTTINDGETPEPRKGLYFGGERREPAKGNHHWEVLCLDWSNGRIRWRQEVHHGTPQNPLHVKNSYASETPVTDGKSVYAYFGNVGLFSYDFDGNLRWSTNWPPVRTRNGWGSAASPILHGDRLYLVNDNEDQSFVVALDKETGRQLWRVDRDEPSNWATPFIWQNERRTELITPGRKKVRSYDLDGHPLWELGGMSSIVIPTPFEAHQLLYISSGYVGDKVRPVFALRPGASGDITPAAGQTTNAFIAWSDPAAGPYNPSPLVLGDYLYVLFDFGFFSCYEAATGRLLYEKERLEPDGRAAFTASPWGCADRVYCLSEDGDTYVIQAGPKFKRLEKNSLQAMCLATPALAADSILIRTVAGLYRIAPRQSSN